MSTSPHSSPQTGTPGDLEAIAKGGRTNVMGFVIRLAGGIPFLLIGYRLYGVEDMGRFASAFVIVEIFALFCALGEKRGLAQRLTQHSAAGQDVKPPVHLVFDGLAASLIVSVLAGLLLMAFPAIMFPNGMNGPADIWMIAALPAYALTEILLAAQAYRYDIATTVRARAIVEPWVKSIAVLAFFYLPATRESGLALAFTLAVFAALCTALFAFLRSYGWPKGWRPRVPELWQLTLRALPLSGADVIERSTRLLDVFLIGQFTSERTVGIYFFAKEIVSLPQKLKSSFEPILSPVITRNLKTGNLKAIAAQVRQVGFWIIAVQTGIALALVIPGEAVMGLGGPAIVGGTGALTLLLMAEIGASTAVVCESVLVYIAKKRNLVISLAVIGLQAALTIGFLQMAERFALDEGVKAAGAALALMLALGASSLVKSLLLARLLSASVKNWRWALAWASGPALVVGFAFTLLPARFEWAELVLGIPAILGVYGWVMWKRGFGEEDKALFRRKVSAPPVGAD